MLFDAPQSLETKVWDRKREDYGQPTCSKRFAYFTPSRERFKFKIKAAPKPRQNFHHHIQLVVAQIFIDDHLEILSEFRNALELVEKLMSDDGAVVKNVQYWRSFFGLWKSAFSNALTSIEYFKNDIIHLSGARTYQAHAEQDQSPTGITNTDDDDLQQLVADFANLESRVKNLSERNTAAFNALMATLSIIESQKAIAQAKTVSKLTKLAFFFIPLTLSSSIFGMNTMVSETHQLSLSKRSPFPKINNLCRNGPVTGFTCGTGLWFPCL